MNRTLMPHQPLIKNQPIASPACSIPSRYQTFVIDNSDKKGFNSGTRRFQETELTDTPGPGHYNSKNHEIEKILLARHKFAKQYSKNYKKHIAKNIKVSSNNNNQNTNRNYQARSSSSSVGQTSAQIQRSMMKKMNGTSRSKSAMSKSAKSSGPYTNPIKNTNLYDTALISSKFQTPGANCYNIAKSLSDRKDFSRAHSSSFQSVRGQRNQFLTPAPNVYKPKSDQGTAISSPFRSSTLRDGAFGNNGKSLPREKRVPSPTHYLINDNMTKAGDRAPRGCFKSKTARSEIASKAPRAAYYKDTSQVANRNPGPGSYGELSDWNDKYAKTHNLHRNNLNPHGSFKGHYLAISAPAIPLPPLKPLPGPGHYDIIDYQGPNKKNAGSSMFTSNTDRWHNEKRSNFTSSLAPGPASYNPKGNKNKKSFMFNADRLWVR